MKETINGHDIIHNKKAVRFEIDEEAGVKESIEITWEDGTVDELDRAIFVKLAGKYPLAFQYPWFAYNPSMK